MKVIKEFLLSLVVIKPMPKKSEIVISDGKAKLAGGLMWLGFFVLLVSFILAIYKPISVAGLELKVDDVGVLSLYLGMFYAFVFSAIAFIGLLNGYRSVLVAAKVSKWKTALRTLGTVLVAVYLSLYTINKAELIGYYNQTVHDMKCPSSNGGSETLDCQEYIKDKKQETSLISKATLLRLRKGI